MAWSKSTTTKHTCGGPVFGKKTVGCPRCDELIAGAKPTSWNIKPQRDIMADIRAHNCKTSNCGPVCTAFEW